VGRGAFIEDCELKNPAKTGFLKTNGQILTTKGLDTNWEIASTILIGGDCRHRQ
jgi:hypothetical protein